MIPSPNSCDQARERDQEPVVLCAAGPRALVRGRAPLGHEVREEGEEVMMMMMMRRRRRRRLLLLLLLKLTAAMTVMVIMHGGRQA
jgi:hypothetical protein